jgi:hypothetical protein
MFTNLEYAAQLLGIPLVNDEDVDERNGDGEHPARLRSRA